MKPIYTHKALVVYPTKCESVHLFENLADMMRWAYEFPEMKLVDSLQGTKTAFFSLKPDGQWREMRIQLMVQATLGADSAITKALQENIPCD